jgi:hypothetical protein
VLFLEFQGDQLFGMFIQTMCPMEETSPLLVNRLHYGTYLPLMILTSFQLTCALAAMSPLNTIFSTSYLNIT